MFETSFCHASSTPLPPAVDMEAVLKILHDFDTVIRLSPDCRGCKPVPRPTTKNGWLRSNTTANATGPLQYFEVEDDLPFIPKRLWSGGVRYTADFVPTTDGCDITVYAPAGFVSTNHWRILREAIPEDQELKLESVGTKDLAHAEPGVGGWHVQISSDAKCPVAFAAFVKGFLKNSHTQLQVAFIDRVKRPAQQRSRRPTIGRRRSSEV